MASPLKRLLQVNLHWNRAWAAGYLEGDGCVSGRGTRTRIQLSTTDEDCVERFASIIGGTLSGPHDCGPGRKPQWAASLSGLDSIMAFYVNVEPYLGARRRARFQEALVGVDAGARITGWTPAPRTWLSWAAGLFEAEGCITFSGTSTLTVTSTDAEVLHRLPPLIGGKVYGPYERPPRKPIFRWIVWGRRSEIVGAALRPWFGKRRRGRVDEVVFQKRYHKGPGQRPEGRGTSILLSGRF